MIIHIDSLTDPALAPYSRLTEAQLRSGRDFSSPRVPR